MLDCKIQFNPDSGEYFVVNPCTNEFIPLFAKKTTKSTKTISLVQESLDPKVTVDSNKLLINTKAQQLLGVSVGDSIAVSYVPDAEQNMIPVIGKASELGQSGNKLTKSGSISFRGRANTELAKFGTEFSLEAQGNVFKLVPPKVEIKEEKLEIKEPDQSILEKLSELNQETENSSDSITIAELISSF